MNHKLREHLNAIIILIQNTESLNDINKEEVTAVKNLQHYLGFNKMNVGFKTFDFSNNDDINTQKQLGIIFDKLKQDSEEIVDWLKRLISIIDTENKEIYDFLNKKNIELGTQETLLGNLKTKYVAEKLRLWGQLRLKLGEGTEQIDLIISKTEESEEELAKKIIELYTKLEELVMSDKIKNDMRWDGIYQAISLFTQLLSRLGKYEKTILNLIVSDTMKEKKEFKVKAKRFCQNYFKAPKTFENYQDVHNEKFKEAKIYSALEDEPKKEIDSYLSNSLSLLFEKIIDVENKLKEDSKLKEDVEEEVKAYYIARDSLFNILNSDSDLFTKIAKKDQAELVINVYGNGLISFKNFESTYITDKTKLGRKQIIINITNYLNSVSEIPEDFLKIQKISGVRVKNSTRSKITDDVITKVRVGLRVLGSATEDSEDFKNNSSNLLAVLFEGKPVEKINEKMECTRFEEISKSFGKNKDTHQKQIRDALQFAKNNSNELINCEYGKWKQFYEKLKYLIE